MNAAGLRQRQRMRFGGGGAVESTYSDQVEDTRRTGGPPEVSLNEEANTPNDDMETPCGAELTIVEGSAESTQAAVIPSEFECILCLR